MPMGFYINIKCVPLLVFSGGTGISAGLVAAFAVTVVFVKHIVLDVEPSKPNLTAPTSMLRCLLQLLH